MFHRTLLHLFLFCALLAPAAAAAQTAVRVSNEDKGFARDVNLGTTTLAQPFTTGGNFLSRFNFTSFRVHFGSSLGTPTGALTAQVFTNNNGSPGVQVGADLTTSDSMPGVPGAGKDYTWNAPSSGITLLGRTTYYVVISDASTGSSDNLYRLQNTDDNGEKSDTTSGWSMGDVCQQSTNGTTWTDCENGGAFRIEINGTTASATSFGVGNLGTGAGAFIGVGSDPLQSINALWNDFTTGGTASQRFPVHDVVVSLHTRLGTPGNLTVNIERNGTVVGTLSGPVNPAGSQNLIFIPTQELLLSGNTAYSLVARTNIIGMGNSYQISAGSSNVETGSSSGWSIAGNCNSSSLQCPPNLALKFQIRTDPPKSNNAVTLEAPKPLLDRSVDVGESFSFGIGGVFNDPDGDVLTYTVTSSAPNIGTVNINGETITINGVRNGTIQMTVNASDGATSAGHTSTVEITGAYASARDVAIRASFRIGSSDGTGGRKVAQPFTTGGTKADRFPLRDLLFDHAGVIGTPENLIVTVHQPDPNTPANPANTPLITLTGPAKPYGGGNQMYAVPSGSTLLLKGNTTYFMVLSSDASTGNNYYRPWVTVDDNEDSFNTTGWSVGNQTRLVNSPNAAWVVDGGSLRFRLRAGARQNNRAPTSSGTIAALNMDVGDTQSFDVAANFNDPDGDTLSYTATSSAANIASVTVSGSTVRVSALQNGSAQITVRASDGAAAVVQMFSVTVTGHAASNLDIGDNRIFFLGTGGGSVAARAAQSFVTGGGKSDRFPLLDVAWHKASNVGTPGLMRLTVHEARQQNAAQPATTALITLTGEVGAGFIRNLISSARGQNLRLKGATTYFVMWHPVPATASGANYYRPRVTGGPDEEDSYNSDGWSVGDTYIWSYDQGGHSWHDSPSGSSLRLRARTEAAQSNSSGPVAGTTLAAVNATGGDVVTVNLAGAFTDADGDYLTYTVTSSAPAVAMAHVEEGNIILNRLAFTGGNAQITVRASDGDLSAQQSFALTVQAGSPLRYIRDARTTTQTIADRITLIITETGSITTPSGSLALRGAGVNNAVENGTINNRGAITSTNADAVIVRGANSLITNGGRVQALTGGAALVQYGGGNEIRNLQGGVLATVNDAVVQFDGGNVITHAGAITTTTADAIVQAGSNNRAAVTGTGTIDSARHGIRIDGDAATINVLAGARIEANADGIRPTRQNSRVQNAGLIIAGDDAIEQGGGGAMATNQSGGRMEATDTGMEQTGGNNTAINHGVMVTERHAIWQNGGNSRVINSGRMHSTREVAVIHQDGDNNTITIATTGSVTTTGTTNAHGLLQTGRNNTINSAGTVITNAADTDGIRITSTGNTVTLLRGAFVQAVRHAVVQHAGNNTLTTRAGSRLVSVADGVHVTEGGNTITHAGAVTSTGVNGYGIYQRNNGNTITVSGTVHAMGSAADGIRVEGDNNTITLQSGAVITAGRHGVSISGNGNTVIVQAGVTFNCGGMAVDLGGNTLVNNSGGALTCGMLAPPAPGDVVLVSNFRQPLPGQGFSFAYTTSPAAQAFSVGGASTASYTLLSVRIHAARVNNPITTIATIHEANPTNASIPAAAVLATLTTGAGVNLHVGEHLFTPLVPVVLRGGRTYFVVLTVSGSGDLGLRTLVVTGEYGSAGWSIADNGRFISGGAWVNFPGGHIMRLEVRAAIAGAASPNRAPAAQGTLSAVALTAGLTPADSAVVDVSTAFMDADGDTLSYSATSSATGIATVALSGDDVTITAVAAGNAVITITADDGRGGSAMQTVAVQVAAAPVSPGTPPPLPVIADHSYNARASVARTLPQLLFGPGAAVYSLAPALPAGLSFNAAARRIAGVPTVTFARTEFTYSAMDSDGNSAAVRFHITVAPPLIADQNYNIGVAVARTLPPLQFEAAGNVQYALAPTLPAGLTFMAATRRIGGTPTGTFARTEFTYSAGERAAALFHITVAPPSAADINENGAVNADDAAAMYAVLSGAPMRLLAGPAGAADDATLQAVVARVQAWAALAGADINGSGAVDADDALILYHAFALPDLVGDGATAGSGSAHWRRVLLGPLAASGAGASDADLRALLMRANALRSGGSGAQ